ncbi:MAG: rod shape-determining protein MreD [Paramuribaculum sp.]
MNNIALIFWSIALILLQALVFNHVCLFGYAVPFVFLYILVKLPLNMSKEWLFTIAFFVGLIVDIFSDTLGMNALACTLTMALRRPVIRLYVAREDELTDPRPGLRTLGTFTFIKFVLTVSLIFCTFIFFIESFSTLGLVRVLLRIGASTLLTTLLIVGIDSLTIRKREERL